MPIRPEIFDAEGVLNFYDLQGEQFTGWRIYAGERPDNRLCRAEYSSSDKVQGREALHEAVEAIQRQTSNTNNYCLEVFTDEVIAAEQKRGRKKSRNQMPIKTVVFKLNGNEMYKSLGTVANFGNDSAVMQVLKQQNEILAAMASKISALEAENEEDDEDEEDDDDTIGSLLKSPEIKNLAINLIAGLFQPKQSAGQPGAIAGMPTDDARLSAAIETLAKNDAEIVEHLEKLAAISEKNPAFFNTLLSMLNGMQ